MKTLKKNPKPFDFDKNYVPVKPTLVLTATVRGTTILSKLYGEVTPERVAREQAATQYRADQLAPVPKRPERLERDPIHREQGVYIGAAEVEEMRRMQSGGRR